ncbi:hypothetical protein MHYP_G00147420 [Metynnis hypsauchen]
MELKQRNASTPAADGVTSTQLAALKIQLSRKMAKQQTSPASPYGGHAQILQIQKTEQNLRLFKGFALDQQPDDGDGGDDDDTEQV